MLLEHVIPGPVGGPPTPEKRVEVHDQYDRVLREIVAATNQGAAVAWVRNTVADARAAVGALQAIGLEVTLCHSHFAVCDRNRIEGEVLRDFGKDGLASARRGRMVVATQVIEQSLNVDFDLLASDVAPIDSLIQRGGRLWRYVNGFWRPLPAPRFLIVGPYPRLDPPSNWLGRMDDPTKTGLTIRKTGLIYPDLALLWRSMLIAKREGRLDGGERTRRMIESVYNKDMFAAYSHDFLPAGLRSSALKAERDRRISQGRGWEAALDLQSGYDGANWVDHEVVSAREPSPTLKLRLARLENGVVNPWADDKSSSRTAWALSEAKLHFVNPGIITYLRDDQTVAVAVAKEHWDKFELDVPIIPLEPESNGWWAASVLYEGERGRRLCRLRYHRENGLEFDFKGVSGGPEGETI